MSLFDIGEHVVLKSGSLVMIVVDILKDGLVTVAWENGEYTFPEVCLRAV